MVNIGRYNNLRVIKEVDFGVYLDGEIEGEILMPVRYVPKNCQVGDNVDVFDGCEYTDFVDGIFLFLFGEIDHSDFF